MKMILSVENENEKEKKKERMNMRKYMRVHYFVRMQNICTKYMRMHYFANFVYCIYEKVYENA